MRLDVLPRLLGVLLMSSCIVTTVDAVQVFLYRDLNFKGLTYTYIESVPQCHNVADYARGEIGSVKSDTCLMIFEQPGCTGNSFKLSRDMPEVADLRRRVVSFQPCSAEFGGDKIRVDMYDDGGRLIAEYKDVCGCQDLPSQVSTKLQRLNNYGNCITVYSSSTCSGGDSKEIPAGQNGLTQNLPQLGYYVRSMSGCGTRRPCVKLTAEIFKFVILSDTSKSGVNAAASTGVELSTRTTFYNNGSATVSQIYEARKTVTESTTMSISKTITGMESSSSSWGVGVEVKVSVPIPGTEDPDKANGKVGASVGANVGEAYKNVVELGNSNSSPHTTETKKEYVVRQTFEVPACTQYEVTSTLTMVENLPLIYEIYARITAEASGVRLTAEEVALQVDEMTFVGVHDEYTAIFKTAENLIANMGVETIITGEGHKIEGCNGVRPSAIQ